MRKRKVISLIMLGTSLAGVLNPVIANATGSTFTNAGTPVEFSPESQKAIQDALKEAEKDNNNPPPISNGTKEYLDQVDSVIKIAEKNPTKQTAEDAITAFANLDLTENDVNAHRSGDQFDKLFYRIVAVINKLPTELRNQEFITFDKKINETWSRIRKGIDHKGEKKLTPVNNFFKDYMEYFETKLNIPEIKKEIHDIWVTTTEIPPGPVFPKPMLPDDAGKETTKPGVPDPEPTTKKPDNAIPFDPTSSRVHYSNERGTVYKITEYRDINGNIIRTTREVAPKEDWIVAGVYTYANFGGGSRRVPLSEINAKQWKYIKENQNPESNLTVQYCINKDTDNPYYYDTGIRASLDGQISYEQLRDVLYQVSIKSGGWFTEDTNKLLAIVEGKPILAKDTKKVYTTEDINLLFSGFKKVDVKILETRIGKSQDIDETVISKDTKNIKIDDKDVQLITAPLIKESRVLFPIQQIATEMGATVKTVDNKYIITRNLPIWRKVKGVKKIVGYSMDTVVYEMNKNYVIVNGQTIETGTVPDMKDGNFMAEVQGLAKALGYKLSWDPQNGTLKFKS